MLASVPNTYSKIFSILYLKVPTLSQLDISGLREFQSVIVGGKTIFEKVGFNRWGMSGNDHLIWCGGCTC